MKRLITIFAATMLTTPALAQYTAPLAPQQPNGYDQSACQGDPRCRVVEPGHPALQGGSGMYFPAPIDGILLNGEAVKKGDCGRYLYDHENYHRKQHQEGKGNDPWLEEDARQNAPTYNCGSRPRVGLGDYEGNKTPRVMGPGQF